jgi:hypothetical protein
MSQKTIDVGYDDINGITVTINNSTTPLYYNDIYSNNPDPNINAKSRDFQQKMRYLDSKKDLLGLGGFNRVILDAYGLNLNDEPPYVDLKRYKESIIQQHAEFIETKSWAKTKIRASLEVDLIAIDEVNNEVYLFRESSMDLSEDIVDASNVKITSDDLKDMACFSNTILDPLKRSFLYSNAKHFPEAGTSLVFNQSFIDGFLRFVNCTYVSSTLTRETHARVNNEDRYTYNYNYNISYSNGGSNGTQIYGSIIYPNNLNNPNDPNYNINNSSIINKYVIGNENKRLTIQSNNAPNGDRNYKEHIVQIKEMGDVLQVFTMLVWMIYKKNEIGIGATLDTLKKTFLMTTIDAIVFILCIMFRLPCIVYEFKEESDQDIKKPNSGRTRYLQRYRPVELTLIEKKNLIITEITNHNDKIKQIIQNMLNFDYIVYISQTYAIKINPDLLKQLIRIIDYLNYCVDFYTTYGTKISQPADFIFETSSAILYKEIQHQERITGLQPLEPIDLIQLEYYLKSNCKISDLFYIKNVGNQNRYYSMKTQKYLTRCQTVGNPCHFACNNIFNSTCRLANGKVSFEIYLQRYKLTGQNGGAIITSSIIEYTDITGNYDETADILNITVTDTPEINMHKILLGDLFDYLNSIYPGFVDGYSLYSIYTLFAFDCDIFNEVFYLTKDQPDLSTKILSNQLYNGAITMETLVDKYLQDLQDITGITNVDEFLISRLFIKTNETRYTDRDSAVNFVLYELFTEPTPIDNSSVIMNSPMQIIELNNTDKGLHASFQSTLQIAPTEYYTSPGYTTGEENTDIEEEPVSRFQEYYKKGVDPTKKRELRSKKLNEGREQGKINRQDERRGLFGLWGGTRKNKRKQHKKYKSYNRKNKTKSNRKSKKHNKSKNNRKPNKTQRKHK